MSNIAEISFEKTTADVDNGIGVNAKSVIATIAENARKTAGNADAVTVADDTTAVAVVDAAAVNLVAQGGETAVEVPHVVDAKADKHVKVLEDLGAKKAAALQKIADKFAEKEFKAKQKLVSLSVRRQVAHDLIEGMRNEVRAHVGQPYLEDEAVDKLITVAFAAGLATVAV